MQKVFVFGSTGMLGRYMTSYLKKNSQFEVIEVTRSEIDAYSVDTDFIIKFLHGNDVSISSDDVVINCMARAFVFDLVVALVVDLSFVFSLRVMSFVELVGLWLRRLRCLWL